MIHLTTLEDETLQALASRGLASCVEIQQYREYFFGADPVYSAGAYSFPAINFALGHLAQKGLVESAPSPFLEQKGYRSHNWKLTDYGKQVSGIA